MRKTFGVILLVLAALLAIPSVTVLWVHREIANVEGYAATAERIISEPSVQALIADKVATEIMEHLPVTSLLNDAVGEAPPRLAAALTKIQPALYGAVNDYINRAVTSLVSSPEFAAIWDKVVRLSHQAVRALLQGEGRGVRLDLGPVVQEMKTRLNAHGFTLANEIPDLHPEFTLVNSPTLTKARDLYSVYQVLRWLLPVLTFLCLVGGVLLARDHWSGLMWGAIGIALAMGVTGAITLIVRAQIGDGQLIFDAFAASLYSLLRWMFLIAVVVAGLAYLIPYRRRHSEPPHDQASSPFG